MLFRSKPVESKDIVESKLQPLRKNKVPKKRYDSSSSATSSECSRSEEEIEHKKPKTQEKKKHSSLELNGEISVEELPGENTSQTAKKEILANLRKQGRDHGQKYVSEYLRIRVCLFHFITIIE